MNLRLFIGLVQASVLLVATNASAELQPLPRVSKIAVGGSHVCAIADGGRMFCWGKNTDGQLGVGDWVPRLSASPIQMDAQSVLEIAAGGSHTCALLVGGQVRCWGSNSVGQLGNGDTAPLNSPSSQVELPSPAVSIFADYDISCAVLDSGLAYCWGNNSIGQITSSGVNVNRPTLVDWVGQPVSHIASTGGSICMVFVSGEAKCRGYNDHGQLGSGNPSSPNPSGNVVNPNLPARYVSTAGGEFHNCSVMSDRKLFCWGQVSLGVAQASIYHQPNWVEPLGSSVNSVSATRATVCALTVHGVVNCVGFGFDFDLYGDEGHGKMFGSRTYSPVVGIEEEIVSIDGERLTQCAVARAGRLYCWGDNSNGQLGIGSVDRELLPARIVGVDGAEWLSHGFESACASGVDTGSKCWGGNSYGELGIGSFQQRIAPSEAVEGIHLIRVVTGAYHSCGLDSGKRAFCWGYSAHGRLGVGPNPPLSGASVLNPFPVDILGPGLLSLDIGRWHGCAVDAGGEVFCWGRNGAFQLGATTPSWSDRPIRVEGLREAMVAVVSGFEFQCALTAAGDGYCWGDNSLGQFGSGLGGAVANPTRLPKLVAPIAKLVAGHAHACALLSDRSVWCWGGNAQGQLGLGTTGGSQLPSQVITSDRNVKDISSKYNHTCVVFVSGEVECWGVNSWGRLGDGTEVNRNVPTPVVGLSEAIETVSAGYYSTCGKGQSGVWYCWGRNDVGELGIGGGGARSFAGPVMVESGQLVGLFGDGFE